MEAEKDRITAQIELDRQLQHDRAEVRLARQQEEQDRIWREKELRKAKVTT